MLMDLLIKFNDKHITDRQIDTLIGLSMGMMADGKLVQSEVEFLLAWLNKNQYSSNPIILNLLGKIDEMLKDGIMDEEELSDLFSILHRFSGEYSQITEPTNTLSINNTDITKTNTLPINNPMPEIEFNGKLFLFTGTCGYGSRSACEQLILSLGGKIASGVVKNLNYLILGTYVNNCWAHETFGRKIEKAIEYRSNGVPLAIITEEHWLKQTGIKP